MSTRVNLILDDEVKHSLDKLVPAGRRSEFANEAIRTRLADLKRQKAVKRLDGLRRKGPSVPASEVVKLLRQAREGSR
ncbi:MAG: hypothetical protein V3T83_04335 [Acidobacteriota bacterium]